MEFLLKQKEEALKGDNWLFWRVILWRVMTFTEACAADMETIYEANAALNKKIELERRAAQQK